MSGAEVAPPTGGRRFGKYTLLDKIGSGGMAEIWRASLSTVDGFEKILVVKKILPRYAHDRGFITMFIHEAKVCSGLQHANVVQIYELGEEEGEYFIAMEYVQGYDLFKVLSQATKRRMAPPMGLCLYVASQLCKALGYAHSATDLQGNPLNIIHRDVSPSNVLLSKDGEVKLTDFGVARAGTGDDRAGSEQLKGKLGYMSPEQVTGKPIDRRSDLFSLGIVLYEMMTLKRLFLARADMDTLNNIRGADIESRLAMHPEIPPAVAEIIRRSLSRNVDSRYQTAHALEDDISRYLFDERVRVTSQDLGRFLRDLFSSGDASEEAASRLGPAMRSLEEPVIDPREPSAAASRLAETNIKVARPLVEHSIPASGVEASDDLLRADYRLTTPGGEVFGPVNLKNLIQLAAAHSLSPDELVSIDGGPWTALRSTELADLLPVQGGSATTPPTESGAFGFETAAGVLLRIASRSRTGRLKVTQGALVKTSFFRRGKPVHITSNVKRELIGSTLIAQGVLTWSQLDEAIRRARMDGVQLGAAIVAIGLMDQPTLYHHLERQFREKFIGLLSWDEAQYAWYDGDKPPADIVPFTLLPIPTVTEAVRSQIPDSAITAYLESRMRRTIRVVSEQRFDPSELKLKGREARMMTRVFERPLSVRDALDRFTRSPEDVQILSRVIFLLHQAELLRIA